MNKKLMVWISLLLVPLFISAAWAAGDGPDAPMNEKVLTIPGDPSRPVSLQVTLLTPVGPGPFPLAVLNHGAAGNQDPRQMPRWRATFLAYYFLSRGYAVVLPMMRGHAGSGGKIESYGCDVATLGLNYAKDIRAVIGFMSSQPNIDNSRIVIGGLSMGGWNTLAMGTWNDPRLKGLINFVGGVRVSNCLDQDGSLIRMAGLFGAHTTKPSIWFYGNNDSLFHPALAKAMFNEYVSHGGKADLVTYSDFIVDAHKLLSFPEGLGIWVQKVDAFLAKIGLPNKLLHPEYLPTPFPPASHYAEINDIEALPYLGQQGQEYYQRFLNKPLPRALAIGQNGMAASFSGGFDPVAQALHLCQKTGKNCRIYAVDNYVSWTRPTPSPTPTQFARLSDASAVPYLNEAGRDGYRKFLTLRKPRAFVIAPDGGWDLSVLGGDPIDSALTACKKTHNSCRLYAVDGDVVWTEKGTLVGG